MLGKKHRQASPLPEGGSEGCAVPDEAEHASDNGNSLYKKRISKRAPLPEGGSEGSPALLKAKNLSHNSNPFYKKQISKPTPLTEGGAVRVIPHLSLHNHAIHNKTLSNCLDIAFILTIFFLLLILAH